MIGVSFIYELLESLERYGSLRFTWAADGERLRLSVDKYGLARGGFIGSTEDLEVNNIRQIGGSFSFVMLDLRVPRFVHI